MSLAADLSGLARDLVAPEGMPITFTRLGQGTYDAISNTSAASVPVTWQGVGMWVANPSNATTSVTNGTAQLQTLRTLLIAGLGVAAPMAGDVAIVHGVEYVVANVTHVADTDGTTVPLFRVQVLA